MSLIEDLGWVGVLVTLAGVGLALAGHRLADFTVAVGSTVVGTSFLFDRLDVRHLVGALICYAMAVVVIAGSVREEKKRGKQS